MPPASSAPRPRSASGRRATSPSRTSSWRRPSTTARSTLFSLKSYGLFGEVYFDVSDKLRLTGGIRYSNDKKRQIARVPLAQLAGALRHHRRQHLALPRQFRRRSDGRRQPALQHRPRRLRRVHRPLRRRLQSDARQPPLRLLVARLQIGRPQPADQPDLRVPATFEPEIINAFEIGSKNSFANGKIRLNLSAFYYDYKGLQLSRIVARTSVNDNTDAEIYGAEAEAVFRPTPRPADQPLGQLSPHQDQGPPARPIRATSRAAAPTR